MPWDKIAKNDNELEGAETNQGPTPEEWAERIKQLSGAKVKKLSNSEVKSI